MSVPGNSTINSALAGGGWSPERELLEAAPRRYAPSPWPDYNQPNAPIFLGAGGLLLVAGLVMFFIAVSLNHIKHEGPYIFGGAVLALFGAALFSVYPVRRKQYMDRASNLIENGAPVMARIVNVQNSTGDSQYGRLVTYMVTMPGDVEETRKEIIVDDRALPKVLPGPATALIEFKSNDIELYCALPFIAVSKFAASAARQQQPTDLTSQTGIPTLQQPTAPAMARTQTQSQSQTQMPSMQTTAPAESGEMAGLGQMGSQPVSAPVVAVEAPKEPKEPKRPTPAPGVAKLPWEQ